MVVCKGCGNIAHLVDSEDELDKFRCKSCEYNFWRDRASQPQSMNELAINARATEMLPQLENPSSSNNPNHDSLSKNTITHPKNSTGFEGLGDLFSSKSQESQNSPWKSGKRCSFESYGHNTRNRKCILCFKCRTKWICSSCASDHRKRSIEARAPGAGFLARMSNTDVYHGENRYKCYGCAGGM